MQLKIDWSQIDLEQFRRGLEVELEHGAIDSETNVTGDDLALTGKIAWAHLKEIRDYYTASIAWRRRQKSNSRSLSKTNRNQSLM
jgi:hypothetical protein